MARLALLVLAACGGTQHADLARVATSTYCAEHACDAVPPLIDLRDGCFQLERGPLYQCIDTPAACYEVPACAEQCETTVRVPERGVVALDACRDRAIAWRDAHATITCDPVRVTPAGDLAGVAIELPHGDLALPQPLALAVARSGKDKVVYAAAVCVAAGEVTVEPRHVPADPALASWLHDLLLQAPRVHATFDAHCNEVALVLSHFACR